MNDNIHPVTKEAEEVLKNKAPVSVQLKMEQEKNRDLTVALKITWACIAVWIVANGIAFVTSYKTVMTYESVCPACNYNLCLPTPVPTPSK